MKGLLTMSKSERDRLRVIQAVQERRMSQGAGGATAGVVGAPSQAVVPGIARAGRGGGGLQASGQPHNRRIEESEGERVLKLVRQHYEDLGPTLAAEYLAGHRGYAHGTETLRQLMMASGIC